MDPIYIFKSGKLSRKANTIVFEEKTENARKKYIPVENLLEIKVFGEIDLNKRLLEFLAQKRIPIHFFNNYGHYVGSFYPYEFNSNGITVLEQSRYYLETPKRLELAQKIIYGAVLNMLKLLKYYNQRGKNLDEQINRIDNLLQKISETDSIEALMAIEGNVRELYYDAIDSIVSDDDFKIILREKRPPTNYMNTLISFGNSLLYSTVLTEMYKTSLDPRIGFLHSTNFRRFSLNLDIAEIFKPVIVDRTILSLVNKKKIDKKHFTKISRGIHLNDAGRKIFIESYEKHLNTTIKHRKLKRNISYRTLIRHEAYKIIKHILGEREFKPFVLEV
ncbi:MAG: CRISP-associated protein Cas1 [Thermotogaceae bacterium]|jgi:CRISPR-associated protein Cas1|nr:CRISP-associated protein Cas1 [Thermotogaceae bacterium]MDN5338198.1 CRISP-associated protein Cas1 [Thermotogaceae bacterium]